jgi:hypothetical protein
MDNIDWLITLIGDLDRELAIDPTDEARSAMWKLVDAVWQDYGLITAASINPLWQKPGENVVMLQP